jgi:hypothetical protein
LFSYFFEYKKKKKIAHTGIFGKKVIFSFRIEFFFSSTHKNDFGKKKLLFDGYFRKNKKRE